MSSTVNDLRTAFAELTEMHGWAAQQTPRNMTMALTACVGAVAGNLQFASDEKLGPDSVTAELRAQIADCMVYLLALGDRFGINVVDEATSRIRAAVAADRDPAQAR